MKFYFILAIQNLEHFASSGFLHWQKDGVCVRIVQPAIIYWLPIDIHYSREKKLRFM